jgi:MATE family multidrug resistance protein
VSLSELRSEMWALSLFGGRLAAAELILFSVFLTDIVMLGYMSELSLSAALLANALFVVVFVTALGFLQGALPLASRYFKQGRTLDFHGMVIMSCLQAVALGVLVGIIFMLFPVLLRLISYPVDLIAESWAYIAWVLPAYMLSMLYIAVRNAVIATGNSRGFMTLSFIALGLNAALNYLLGFGFSLGSFAFGGMGISGIGLASSLGDCILFGGVVYLLFKNGFHPRHFPISDMAGGINAVWRALRPYLAPTLAIGIPVGIVFFIDTTLFSVALIIVGRHDVQGMAALAVIREWSALAIMIPVGLSEAIVQRVAQATDRIIDPDRFRILATSALYVSLIYTAVLAFIYFGLGINVPALFIVNDSAHPGLLARLDDLALLALLAPVTHSFVICLSSILRGIMDVNTSLYATIACYWGIGLGLTFLFVEYMALGADYALLAVVIGQAASAIWIGARLRFQMRHNPAAI